MKHLTTEKRQTGMTLVEIMIAMLIGAFLIGGILQIFISSKQTYRMQEGLSRLQENGRFAMEFLTRDIRMADYWGCLGSSVGNIDNNLKPDPDFDNLGNGIEAQNDDNGGNDGDADNDENGNSIWDGTDIITLRGISETGIFVTAIPATTAAALQVTASSGLVLGDILIVSDCTDGDIFQISSNVSADTITHNVVNIPGIPPNGNADTPFRKIYGLDAQLYRISATTYSIQNGAGNQPSLFRDANELVEGIEDMQIFYGEDTDADNTPDYYVTADNIADMDNVVSIRIGLLVASIDDNLTSQPITYTFNGVVTTPTDRKIRRVFTSTIGVRNRLQ